MKELSLNHREYKLCHYLRPWEEDDKSATISFRIPVTLDGTTDDLLWASPWWTAVHLSPPQHRLHSGLASNDVLLHLPTPYQYRRIPRCVCLSSKARDGRVAHPWIWCLLFNALGTSWSHVWHGQKDKCWVFTMHTTGQAELRGGCTQIM